jgi:hypothetical protein
MMTFKEFFLKEHVVMPRHRTTHAITTRGNKFTDDGSNLQSANIMANCYKPTDANFDQNSKQKVGGISPDEAEELISKHGLNRHELEKGVAVGLGKRPFKLFKHPQTKQFNVIKY